MMTLKILLTFASTVALLNDFELEWPNAISGFFQGVATTSTFSLDASFADCALQWSPYLRFMALSCAVPVITILPGIAIRTIVDCHRWGQADMAAKDPDYVPIPLTLCSVSPLSLYTTVSLLLLFLLYPTVTTSAMQILRCTEEVDGVSYLAADVSFRCDTSLHRGFSYGAWGVLVLFTVGFPVVCAIIMYRFRDRLDTEKARRRVWFLFSVSIFSSIATSRSHRSTCITSTHRPPAPLSMVTRDSCYPFIPSAALLPSQGYRNDTFYYESVIMARKSLLVAVSVMLGGNEFGHQIFCGILVQLAALILHLQLQPFRDYTQGQVEQYSIITSLLVLLLGQLLALGGISDLIRQLIAVAIAVLVAAVVLVCLSLLVYDFVAAARSAELAERVRKALQLLEDQRAQARLPARKMTAARTRGRRRSSYGLEMPDGVEGVVGSDGFRVLPVLDFNRMWYGEELGVHNVFTGHKLDEEKWKPNQLLLALGAAKEAKEHAGRDAANSEDGTTDSDEMDVGALH